MVQNFNRQDASLHPDDANTITSLNKKVVSRSCLENLKFNTCGALLDFPSTWQERKPTVRSLGAPFFKRTGHRPSSFPFL